MNLLEVLLMIGKGNRIAVNNEYELGIVYSAKVNCYVWCSKDGGVVEDSIDYTGFKRVILSPKVLERDDWYLKEE